MRVTEDVLWNIQSYLEPDLAMFVRLAAVNRTFYTVFTSDKLWKYLNPYGVESGIFMSFKDAVKDSLDSKLLNCYWVCGNQPGEPLSYDQLKTLTKNRFVWLGFLLSSIADADYFAEYDSLLQCAVDILYKRGYAVVEPQCMLNSKKWAIKLQSLNPALRKFYLDPAFCFDPEIIAAAASGKPFNYDALPCMEYVYTEEYMGDANAELAVINDPRNIEFVSEELRIKFAADREWVMATVEKLPYLIQFFPTFSDDQEVISRVFKNPLNSDMMVKKGYSAFDCLKYASDRLRHDYAICKMAIDSWPRNVQYSLVNDVELLKYGLTKLAGNKSARCQYIHLSRFVSDVLSQVYGEKVANDKEINRLLALCSYLDLSPDKLSPIFFEDYIMVLSLFQESGCVKQIEKLPDRYRLDPEFVCKAMNSGNRGIWRYLAKDMRRNPDVALKALEIGVPLYEIEKVAGPLFSGNRELVKMSADLTPHGALFKTPPLFADDEEILTIAVEKKGCALEYASPRLKSKLDLIAKALDTRAHIEAGQNCPCAPFKWVAPGLLEDLEVLKKVVRLAGACPPIYSEDRELTLYVLERFPDNYRYIPQAFKESLEFNIEAAALNGSTLRFMTARMWNDTRVLEAANFRPRPGLKYLCGDCFE